MGRHSNRANRVGRRTIAIAASVVIVGLLIGGTGAAWVAGVFTPERGTDASCPKIAELSVIADPSIAPAVTEVAESMQEGDECARIEVRSQDSADTAAVLASGTEDGAHLWIPDSAVWADRMAATAASLGRTAPEIEVGEPIASTPIVFAAPAERAAEFEGTSVGWTALLAGTLGAVMPDPESSAASLAGLLTLRSHASPDDPRQFAAAVLELGKTIPPSLDAAFSAAGAASRPTVVVTTERAVASANTAGGSDPLVALYPADGTSALTYPIVTVSGAAERPRALADEFGEALAAADFAADGFRRGDGSGRIDAMGVIEEPTDASPAVDAAPQIEILRSWGVLNLRSRILSVIDVSGSMIEPAEGGLRRIDIFQQAASGALQKFSGEVEMGVWVFSTDRPGGQNWEDLAPIAPLGDPAHAQQIGEIIAGLPARISGDTALYDTTLAAVDRVREEFDPGKVNSVLLITDGRNDADGIDLPTLLAELEARNDPLRPVPVIFIGFGPDTDLDAMNQIARATGGAAYSATRPSDLGLVLVDALSQRSCRPNCG